MKRCLIVGCSETKLASPTPLPALELYDGPAYRVIRRFLGQAPLLAEDLDVFVLSAEHGLIVADAEILPYDHLMTPRRARELRPAVLSHVREMIAPQPYSEVFLSMGKAYLRALDGFESLLAQPVNVIVSSSSAGGKLAELKRWLWGDDGVPFREKTPPAPVEAKVVRQQVMLRGRAVRMTTQEATDRLRQELPGFEAAASMIRDWYVDVEGDRLSPKWVASRLFGVPVREFSADEARRALRALGLNCYRVRVSR